MALALYRKYRPQTFHDITDQNHVKITLEREVATNKVAHAYLFSGPRGTGKTSMARILAKAVNCETRKDGKGEPCGKCAACTEITSGRSLDVIEIDAASYTGVDTVRETIIETAKFAPSRLKYKVFIIDEVHMLSTSAWNALLKIMEEPPAHVIFILATTEVHKVPATILSRCQRFDFHRVKPHDIVIRLQYIAHEEKVKIAKSVLESIARLSEGCVRDAESILEQLFSLGEKEITDDVASLVLPRTSIPMALNLLDYIDMKDTARALELISELTDQGIDLNQFSGDILELLRKMLLIKTAGGNAVELMTDSATFERLTNICNHTEVTKILVLIDRFVKAKQGLKNASIPQLPLEIAAVEGCGTLTTPSGGADSAIQGSSFVPTTSGGTADAPKIASPHPQTPPLPKGKGGKDSEGLRVSSAELPSSHPVEQTVRKSDFKISLEEIKNKWPGVLKHAQDVNHSLPFLLSTSMPVEVSGDTLQIGVTYQFHCDKLNEQKCRQVLEKILQDVYNVPLRSNSIIVTPQNGAGDDGVSKILSTLGGKLIE